MLPNALSALRLVLAGVFPLLSSPWTAVAVVGAAVTDVADGILARRLGATSWGGGLLDAVADKLFVLSVLLCFVVRGDADTWQIVVLLGRDMVIVAIAAYAAVTRQWHAFRHMPSRLLGKLTTISIFGYFLVVTAWPQTLRPIAVLFAITALLSLASAADYYTLFMKTRQQPA